MDKIIGFSLARLPFRASTPTWLSDYPWLVTWHFERNGWDFVFWGHGDLTKFDTSDGIVVGYSDTELNMLEKKPLQNRGVLIEFLPELTITNDFIGQLPVFYGRLDDIAFVSSCEQCVIKNLGGVTLNPARLVQYLIFQSYVGTKTLWNEINKLYANSVLSISNTGNIKTSSQKPLSLWHIPKNRVMSTIAEITERTVRLYTDRLDQVYLPLSRGKDSGLLLANMQRPDRIHARTMPSSRPLDRSEDVVITRARCANVGVKDHQLILFPNESYQAAYRPQIEYGGTPLSSTQAYIYGINAWIGNEGNHWPLISGSCGDITAGSGVARVLEAFDVRQTNNSRERFKLSCYCQSKEWKQPQLEYCLTFNPMDELAASGLTREWSELWKASEGDTDDVNLDLIRLRNRGSQYITYAWAAADLWGNYVSPYTDRKYVETMLSLPLKARGYCKAQREYGKKYFPHILPNAGVSRDAWDVSNTLNKTTVSAEALWPLRPDGSLPNHRFFRSENIREFYERALSGDMDCFFLLHSLQPLAYVIDEGFVI